MSYDKDEKPEVIAEKTIDNNGLSYDKDEKPGVIDEKTVDKSELSPDKDRKPGVIDEKTVDKSELSYDNASMFGSKDAMPGSKFRKSIGYRGLLLDRQRHSSAA